MLKDLTGRPYIPGSSFKGAFRSHLERLLRSLHPDFACISVPPATGLGGAPGCLTQDDISALKTKYRNDPSGLDVAILGGDVLTENDVPGLEGSLTLTGPCWTCRLCGAPWVASKLMARDMAVVEDTWFDRYLVRDGVAIDRDTETAADRLKYDYEAVPAGTQFAFEMVVENATDAELGLAFLGLREFEEEFVSIGGGRSRGLGKVKLHLDWPDALLVTRDGLREYLLTRETTVSLAQEDARKTYWQTFLNELNDRDGLGTGGLDDAQATA